jgi:hypothetical protein
MRRSPRETTPSRYDVWASCLPNFGPWRPRMFRSMCCLYSVCSTLIIASHWNGVWGFGTNVETPRLTFARGFTARPVLVHPVGQVADGGHVLVGLGRQADHEIELHRVPTAAVDLLGHGHQVVVGDPLVDDRAHPVRGRLRREGEARLPDGAHHVGEVHRKRVGPQTRQAHVGAALHRGGDRLRHEAAHLAVVARAERRQRELLVAGLVHRLVHQAVERLQGALAHGPRGHARLAEPARLRAPAQHLQAHAVVCLLGERHDVGRRVGRRVQVRHHALADHAARSTSGTTHPPSISFTG